MEKNPKRTLGQKFKALIDPPRAPIKKNGRSISTRGYSQGLYGNQIVVVQRVVKQDGSSSAEVVGYVPNNFRNRFRMVVGSLWRKGRVANYKRKVRKSQRLQEEIAQGK